MPLRLPVVIRSYLTLISGLNGFPKRYLKISREYSSQTASEFDDNYLLLTIDRLLLQAIFNYVDLLSFGKLNPRKFKLVLI